MLTIIIASATIVSILLLAIVFLLIEQNRKKRIIKQLKQQKINDGAQFTKEINNLTKKLAENVKKVTEKGYIKPKITPKRTIKSRSPKKRGSR